MDNIIISILYLIKLNILTLNMFNDCFIINISINNIENINI